MARYTVQIPGVGICSRQVVHPVLFAAMSPRYKGYFAGKHVLITGGSEGIGLAMARELVTAGANITLVARSEEKLATAQTSLLALAKECQSSSSVCVQSADVTSFEKIQAAMQRAQAHSGPIDVLICNAGSSTPGYFHEQDVSVFEHMMRLNYFGTLHAVKAVYDSMVTRNSGHIVFISSTMALMGFTGYAAYSASKNAVRGLSDCLRNELQGTHVKISIGFPPDTLTPGFETENQGKPPETLEISEDSKPFPVDQVAKTLLRGIQRGDYFLPNPDIGLQIHATAVKGMVPRSALWLIPDMLVGFLAPIMHMVFAGSMDRTAKKRVSQRFSNLWVKD